MDRNSITSDYTDSIPAPVAPDFGTRFHVIAGEAESVLIDPFSRFFVRHELVLRPARNSGAPVSLLTEDDELDVVNILTRAAAQDKATLVLKKSDVIKLTRIEHRPKENMLVLLFRRSDPNATNPVFENRKTKSLWAPNKGPDDAEAISAHLFIDLDGRRKPHPAHKAILEEVPGLGRSYVQSLLHEIITEHRYPYLDARGEQKETWTIPTLEGVKSETLGHALEGGGLEYIELVQDPDLNGSAPTDTCPQR